MKKMVRSLALLGLLGLVSCGEDKEKEAELKGQLGHTCYAFPVLKDPDAANPYNLCRQTGESFHGGLISMTFALQEAVRACQEANALDMGHHAGRGESCYRECQEVTYCIPFTNG